MTSFAVVLITQSDEDIDGMLVDIVLSGPVGGGDKSDCSGDRENVSVVAEVSNPCSELIEKPRLIRDGVSYRQWLDDL